MFLRRSFCEALLLVIEEQVNVGSRAEVVGLFQRVLRHVLSSLQTPESLACLPAQLQIVWRSQRALPWHCSSIPNILGLAVGLAMMWRLQVVGIWPWLLLLLLLLLLVLLRRCVPLDALLMHA